ncbi:MAG: mechanosensitive ion channel [Candidatus Eremiobacteraeota bacterium]|nr:mechanosensitive ion channel [Candidatus Eremiobacteraeota bacterium]MBC5803010.1 mechanosensitive ion channel [Candidatus Eremiobacteraeota bacterium]MBC5820726.1 mechanosensitive ion channel [Candidatus Eremiobacteraeota bacterium]
MNDAGNAFSRDFTALIAYVPHLFSAAVILVVGGLLAWLIGRAVDVVLTRLGLDRNVERTGFRENLVNVGVRARPARLVARLVSLIVWLATLVQAVDALELVPLSAALRNLLDYTPHLVVAVAILLVGVVAADALARATTATLARAGILYHTVAGTLMRAIVIVLAALMALQQLTIESSFLLDVLLLLLGSAALSAALASGFGARTFFENAVASRYVEENFQIGDRITVDGAAGTVERLGMTSVVVVTNEQRRIVLPNGIFARFTVHVDVRRPVASEFLM